MSAYCISSDLYAYGLPRGGLPNPGRIASAVSTSANTITVDGHGFALNAQVTFRAESGGSLPSPLAAGTAYYAIPVTDSTFQVATASGGGAVDLTTAGVNVVCIAELPFDECIEWASNLVEGFLPAHVVPLTAPYPPVVVACTADLAASRLLAYVGGSRIDQQAKLVEAQRMLERWAKAIPIRGAIRPASANMAITGSVSGSDPRGWIPTDGTIP
jgi:hypothetical protein